MLHERLPSGPFLLEGTTNEGAEATFGVPNGSLKQGGAELQADLS